MHNHSTNHRARLYAACLASLLMLAACGGGGGGGGGDDNDEATPIVTKPQAANPVVEGPVNGGGGESCCKAIVGDVEIDIPLLEYVPATPFYAGLSFDEAELGYRETEYFIAGTATSYIASDELREDGMWSIQPADTAPFKSRIVVLRPEDAAAFNGTVIVEWLNVSVAYDAAPDLVQMHTELVRKGYAWVGVSAQSVGIEGGDSSEDLLKAPLKVVDPDRYGSLSHPGDSFSYDIYSQAAQAVRHPMGIDPLDGLQVQRMIGVGESQSAGRMATYVNAIHPTLELFDGFLIHSRGGSRSAPLSEEPQVAVSTPQPALIRTDFPEPVLNVETETDIFNFGSATVSQPDAPNYRQWEIAGSAHSDAYSFVKGPGDRGSDPSVAKVIETQGNDSVFFAPCDLPINDGPSHWVLKAAIAALDHWIDTGEPAPSAQPLTRSADGTALQRDQYGNAVGGVRTPYVDAPVATFYGSRQSGADFCFLFGTTVLFDLDTLTTLYPTTDDYINAIETTTDSAVDKGFILLEDGELIKAQARKLD